MSCHVVSRSMMLCDVMGCDGMMWHGWLRGEMR